MQAMSLWKEMRVSQQQSLRVRFDLRGVRSLLMGR